LILYEPFQSISTVPSRKTQKSTQQGTRTALRQDVELKKNEFENKTRGRIKLKKKKGMKKTKNYPKMRGNRWM